MGDLDLDLAESTHIHMSIDSHLRSMSCARFMPTVRFTSAISLGLSSGRVVSACVMSTEASRASSRQGSSTSRSPAFGEEKLVEV